MPKDNVFLNSYGYLMGHGTKLPNMTPNQFTMKFGKINHVQSNSLVKHSKINKGYKIIVTRLNLACLLKIICLQNWRIPKCFNCKRRLWESD